MSNPEKCKTNSFYFYKGSQTAYLFLNEVSQKQLRR